MANRPSSTSFDHDSSDLFGVEDAGSDRISVLLPLPLSGAYDYLASENLAVKPGDFVVAPLGRRLVVGVIWGEGDPGGVAEEKLKPIEAVLDAPPLPKANRDFVDWLSAYYLAPPGAVLKMAMSVQAALEPPAPKTGYAAVEPDILLQREAEGVRMTAARQKLLAAAADRVAEPAADLAKAAGVSVAVVKAAADAGLLRRVSLVEQYPFSTPDPSLPGPELNDEQEQAAGILREMVRSGSFDVALLDGVTGSGKTEVYFEAIAATLEEGRQALVLLPEIALSAQWLRRFEERFGVIPAEWHSDLTAAQRRRTWRGVAEGKVRCLVGARSALHLPFPDLGLVVVDEEHESAFKQEDGVHYHARDMAVVRGRIADCPVILASATPSLESLANVEAGRYRRLVLPERHGVAEPPTIQIVDIRKDKPGRQEWLSPTLRQALESTLAEGEQSLLFLNRRGYAPLTLCRTCGFRLACPNCSSWLVEHRFARRLECHHCGYTTGQMQTCPSCGDTDSFAACGPGVERLAEEVAAFLPGAAIEIVTSDTLHSPFQAAAFVDRMTAKEIDIVIGTQIVAKGYHFPMLTLVGVVDADLGLNGGDLRASERTYQLMQQVAGRAGRAGRPGRVLLQTANPDAPVMQALASGDRDAFLEQESAMRRDFGFPPFGRLAALIVSGPDERAVEAVSRDLARQAPRPAGVQVLGPAPAALALLRGRHRRRLLVKAEKGVSMQKVLADWVASFRPPGQTRIAVDIDPYSFL
ncbi:MAG: primosomal protein N' [Alphaproteobacteria bacterium]